MASEKAKARFESLADALAADPRSFRDLSREERLRRVVGIGRDLFSPSEEIARLKEEEIELEERRFGRWLDPRLRFLHGHSLAPRDRRQANHGVP